jgi:hypothetical protein
MPFNQALFWFGLTAFGTGLYYLLVPEVKRLYSIGMTVVGALACAYTVYADSHPELPAIPLWVILLLLTWLFLGYGVYRRRFHSPSDKVSVTDAEWRAGFSHPRFELVVDHKFENEEIAVDNKSFRRCSFKNVKLLFHGNAPFEFVEGTAIDAGTVFFTTDDPAIRAFNTIQRKFASIPGARIEHGALDEKGKEVLLSPLKVEPISASSRSSQYPIPNLRLKVVSAVSELQGFLGEHGSAPVVARVKGESTKDAALRYFKQGDPWKAKFIGDYRIRFADSIPKLRDELRVRTGVSDDELNQAIDTAANNEEDSCKAVNNIIERLWTLGRRVNA